MQGRHGEFETGKAQYSTPNLFNWLFLIRVYRNPKSRQGPGLGGLGGLAGLASCGGPGVVQRRYEYGLALSEISCRLGLANRTCDEIISGVKFLFIIITKYYTRRILIIKAADSNRAGA